MLNKFLAAINQDPQLAPLRAAVPAGPERQLALLAALERAVLVGSASANPPKHDDDADQLLCDILDCIDQNPDLKNHGAAYGPDRHLANLQALGMWRGAEPIQQPSALELFTTTFSRLTPGRVSSLPASTTNNSPASQDSGSSGELIGPPEGPLSPAAESTSSSQTVDGVLVVSIAPGQEVSVSSPDSPGINHHEPQTPGEQFPTRPVRRGRPTKLDDLAKGRVLGLMSHGLSFRQAAAQLGVHHVTLLNILKRDEEFAQQVSEARLDAISQPLLTVVHASRTNWRAAAWLAKFLEERRARNYESTPEERAVNDMKRT
jgi:hypothetical protein